MIDTYGVEELNNLLTKKLQTDINQTLKTKMLGVEKPPRDTGLPLEIRKLIENREKLRRKKRKTAKDKVEVNILCKAVKIELRRYNQARKEKFIGNILETTASTKKIKKGLAMGTQLTTYLINEKGEREYNRIEINKIATNFYTKLYDDQNLENKNEQSEDTEEPKFLEKEIAQIIKNLKNNKAGGEDGIKNEHIKYGGEILIQIITKLCNEIMEENKISEAWKQSNIILLHKKGDRHDIENYRPISLSPTLLKIFSKLIVNRISIALNEQQPSEQAGFRGGVSQRLTIYSQ